MSDDLGEYDDLKDFVDQDNYDKPKLPKDSDLSSDASDQEFEQESLNDFDDIDDFKTKDEN